MKNKLLLAVLVLLWCTPLYAAPVTFFGEDLGLGEYTRLSEWPNASNAQADFYSHLTGVTTEDFENMTGNIADFGNGLTATLSGGELKTQITGAFAGRYPISGDHYWQSGYDFSITFSEAISAFGFYGIDIGDFDGQVVLTMAGGESISLNIGNSMNILGGSVLYFGFYDLENTYTSITFTNTNAGTDYFGFDDFTIGTLENINSTVPEPATLLLLGAGFAGLAAFRRRRK